MNLFHEANRRGWDAVSPHWQAGIEAQGHWRRCHREPELALLPEERRYLGDVAGRDVAVLGSGDNLVAFALAGLGARVTSVDLSAMQLQIAAERARALGLSIRFVHADVTALGALATATFDVVYTGGHVAVWVSDLKRYYAEAGRILRPAGLLLVNEYHPFRRIWKQGVHRLERELSYYDRGPHQYDRADQAPGLAPGTLPSYNFHWTVSDYVTALLQAGCELLALEEIGEARQSWEEAPLEGLPECLLLVGRKRGATAPGEAG
ncbi:MAG: class I SAM-dependent methyltransferase [Armatimonadetes bacterium]|nr:class I SAM-dependent methyltransferase [Armatimonadota bacterium]